MLQQLPLELIIMIYSHLDPLSAQRFSKTNKLYHKITQHPSARAQLLLRFYGRGQAMYYCYTNHRSMMDGTLAQILVHNRAILSRFLAQLIVKDSRNNRNTNTSLYVFIVNYAFEFFQDDVDFRGNDHILFEALVRARPEETDEAIGQLHELIHHFYFFPVIEQSHKLISESLYLMARMDLSLIRALVHTTGFCLTQWNDHIMERILSEPVSINIVQSYLDVGFCLSDIVIKRCIGMGKPFSFEILDTLVPSHRLSLLAQETIYDLFGPYLDRDNSLNVPWNAFAVQRIIQHYKITDVIIEKALLDQPQQHCTFDKVHTNFPVTRPYLKAKPYGIWKFILENYGPHHRFTMACFDDAISRAVADQSLHHLIDTFLDSGVVIRPRHVKILACRVLHRNMTGNALKLMCHLRKQVMDRYRTTIQLRHSQDHVTQIQPDELLQFQNALKVDMLHNQEWKERSRTIQLGGGTQGGAFRIERAPQDVIRFIEEGTLLLQFVTQCDYQKLETKERKPKSKIGNMSFFRKIKLYCLLSRWFKKWTLSFSIPI